MFQPFFELEVYPLGIFVIESSLYEPSEDPRTHERDIVAAEQGSGVGLPAIALVLDSEGQVVIEGDGGVPDIQPGPRVLELDSDAQVVHDEIARRG